LSRLKTPEGEVDLDAVGIEHLPVEIVGQSFAFRSWLISELQPARLIVKPLYAVSHYLECWLFRLSSALSKFSNLPGHQTISVSE
jgi:hypothetical protein